MFAFDTSKRSNTLTGVVPGTTGVAIVRVRQQHGGQPVLQACDFSPVAADSATDLGQLLKSHGLEKQQCATVLPVGDYQLLVVDAPEVPAPELRAAIRWHIQELIDFHIDDAVLDVFDVPAGGPADARKQLYVVVARAAVVRQHIDQLEQAGANLQTIDIPELALRNIAASLPEDADGLATIYFDEEHCLITLTRQSVLYLARTLNIGYGQLQESASQPQSLSDRLALEIQRSMDYYERHFHQAPVKALAIMPVPVTLYGLANALEQTLGLPTRSISMSDVIECSSEPDELTSARCLLATGVALRTEASAL